MHPRLRRLLPVALAAVVLAGGCFEDPIDQKVKIEFLPKDRAEITTTITIHDDVGEDNPAARARIVEMRRELRDRVDEWSKRYQAIDADGDRLVIDRWHGQITKVERLADVDYDNLSRFFADTSLGVFARHDEDWAEIDIYPGQSNRATREQRTRLDDRLDLWSSKIAKYLNETARVYRYLDDHPALAEPFFTALFQDVLPKERVEAAPQLSEGDQAMVRELSDAMEDAWHVLLVDKDEAFSVNELSSLVYDPFPSDIEVKVPGRVLEAEGFEPGSEAKTFEVRRTTFWNALQSLRSRWVEPDPLTAWVNAARAQAPLDLDDFLAQPRRVHSIPTPDGIRKAIEKQMTPKGEYRIRWRRG